MPPQNRKRPKRPGCRQPGHAQACPGQSTRGITWQRPTCCRPCAIRTPGRSEEHTSELQSPCNLVCRLLLEKKKNTLRNTIQRLFVRSRQGQAINPEYTHFSAEEACRHAPDDHHARHTVRSGPLSRHPRTVD